MYTVHDIVYILTVNVRRTLFVMYTLCSVHYTMYNLYCTLYNVQRIICTVYSDCVRLKVYTLYNVCCIECILYIYNTMSYHEEFAFYNLI